MSKDDHSNQEVVCVRCHEVIVEKDKCGCYPLYPLFPKEGDDNDQQFSESE